jgi:iron complex outermembrane receptor protein
VSPDWQPNRWWQLKGSYSYVRLDLATTPNSFDVNAVSRYEDSSPHHQIRLQSRANLARGTELDVAYRYVSVLPVLRVRAYHSADVRVGWQVAPGLDVSISGQNLLQPSHVEFSHSPPPAVGVSRSAFVGFTWRNDGRP